MTVSDAVAYLWIGLQWLGIVVIILVEHYHTKERLASNDACAERVEQSNLALIRELRIYHGRPALPPLSPPDDEEPTFI